MDEEFLGFASSYEGDQSGLLVGAPVTGKKKKKPEERAAEHSQVSSLPRGQQGASAERPAPASVPHSVLEILKPISLRRECSALFILLQSKSPVDPACKGTCSVVFQEAP